MPGPRVHGDTLVGSRRLKPSATAFEIQADTVAARTHFIAAGYKADTIATNMPISGGILMFRGSDAKDHTTMLILQGTPAKDEKDQNVLTPTGLLLFYVADAKAPDVYRLPPGSF
jgi:hypothetical protein